MKKVIFLILLVVLFLYLFNLYNPFDIKLFNEDDSYTKEFTVEKAKKSVQKKEKTPTARDYFLKGKENLKTHNYKGAILNFSKAIELDSNYIEAYKERALAKDKIDDFDGSKKDYEQYLLILEQQNQKENEEIQQELLKLIEGAQNKANNKQYNEAIVELSNIIYSYPKHPAGYIARADIYFTMKKYKQALDDYQKALSLSNKNLSLYLKLANTKYELELYKDAIQDYIYILNSNSNYEYAYYKLIGAYIFTEDFNKALKILEDYINISKTKNINTKDYDKWLNVLNKYTENETIRDIKSNLKKLKFV